MESQIATVRPAVEKAYAEYLATVGKTRGACDTAPPEPKSAKARVNKAPPKESIHASAKGAVRAKGATAAPRSTD